MEERIAHFQSILHETLQVAMDQIRYSQQEIQDLQHSCPQQKGQ